MSDYVVRAVRHDQSGMPAPSILRASIQVEADVVAIQQAKNSASYWRIGDGGYAWLSDSEGKTIWSMTV